MKPSSGGRRLRILVADDERDTVDTLSAILDAEGHIVLGVYTGVDVLPALRSHDPDVCILDIDLPGPSGFALAKEIREVHGHRPGPLLIAVSGKWTGQTDRMLGQLSGFDHYCVKPCDPQHLLNLIAHWRQQGHQENRAHPTFGKVLIKAAELIGGRAELCEYLGVRARDLVTWLNRDAEPPVAVFLRAVDILVDHLNETSPAEQTLPPRPAPESRLGAEPE
jgi:DNA-binding response OmpR family regulator